MGILKSVFSWTVVDFGLIHTDTKFYHFYVMKANLMYSYHEIYVIYYRFILVLLVIDYIVYYISLYGIYTFDVTRGDYYSFGWRSTYYF